MRRLFWIGVGAATAYLAYRVVRGAARRYGPSGLATAARSSATGALGSVRSFIDDVREGMAEREEEIHAALAEGELLDGDHLTDPDYPATGWADDGGDEDISVDRDRDPDRP